MAEYTLDYTAKEVNDRLGKLDGMPINMELLWENASPTSEFLAQTVTLDLSIYDAIIVYVKFEKSTPYYISQITPVGLVGLSNFIYGASSGIYGGYRIFTVTTSNVKFESAWSPKASGEIQSNNYCIPYRIYGIKGVQ